MEKIEIKKLKLAFEKIIEKLEFENVTEIELTYDCYRIIPTNKWKINEGEKEIENVGSLKDDLEEINNLVNDKERICTYVDFDRISSLLRYISEAQNPSDD